jgi:alpha-glucosidase
LRRDTPEPAFHAQLNLIGSHDTPRLLTLLGGDRSRVKLAAALQLAYPGVPMVYYGDEPGLEGDYAEAGRRAYPWDAPDEDLLAYYRVAINARRGSPALSRGDVITVWLAGRGGYGYLRAAEDDAVLALFNSGPEPVEAEVALGEGYSPGPWPDLLGGRSAEVSADGTLRARLPACAAAWFRAATGRRG